MWFKILYLVLQVFATVYGVVNGKTAGERGFHLIYGCLMFAGYTHYVMGWF